MRKREGEGDRDMERETAWTCFESWGIETEREGGGSEGRGGGCERGGGGRERERGKEGDIDMERKLRGHALNPEGYQPERCLTRGIVAESEGVRERERKRVRECL